MISKLHLINYAKIELYHLTAVVDLREQHSLALTLPTVTDTLATGDYSLRGLEEIVTVERKSLNDLVQMHDIRKAAIRGRAKAYESLTGPLCCRGGRVVRHGAKQVSKPSESTISNAFGQ